MINLTIKGGKTYASLSELKLWDKNPRGIEKDDFERLKKQIQTLGMYKPLIITADGIVLGGNMRLRAYQELGIEEVWVSVVKTETEAKMLEYALSDNDRAGYYEDDKLAELIQLNGINLDLELYKVDLKIPQFDLREVLEQFGPGPEEVEAPPVPEKAVSVAGEVYQLGSHRLLCADATKPESYQKLLGDKKADMVFTDPPYNINFIPRGKQKDLGYLENDNLPPEEFRQIFKEWFKNIKSVAKKGACFYVCAGWETYPLFFEELSTLELTPRNVIVWDKEVLGMGWEDYRYQHEFIIYCWQDKGKHNFYGSREEINVWRVKRLPSTQKEHTTQKPVELCARAIRNSSKPDDIVLDPFLGSGSTLIAAEQLDRVCFGIELDPRYVDVARQRYARTIGREEEWEEITPTIQS